MKHFLCLSLFVTLLAAPAAAASSTVTVPDGDFATLSGTVYNLVLEPVRAAEISIADVGRAFTDLKGYYELPRVPFGTHTVKVTAPGYREDVTDIAIAQRFVEFQTTLQTAGELSPRATMKPVMEPLPMPTLYGLSGRMGLPDTRVLPERAQTVAYSVFRAGFPIPGVRQRVTDLAYTIGLAERLEVAAWSQDAGIVSAGKTSPERSLSGFGLKYAMKPILTGDRAIPCAIGGRNYAGQVDEVFAAFDLPIFAGDDLTFVPTLKAASKRALLSVGWDRTLSRSERVSTAVMLEAIQSVQNKFDLYHAGLRFTFGRDRSAHVIWRHNARDNFRSVGLGAAMAFE